MPRHQRAGRAYRTGSQQSHRSQFHAGGDCHGITTAMVSGAPPVVAWESIGHPIALARHMWNHATLMKEEQAKKRFNWPELTTQDLSDMLVWLRNLPETRQKAAAFDLQP